MAQRKEFRFIYMAPGSNDLIIKRFTKVMFGLHLKILGRNLDGSTLLTLCYWTHTFASHRWRNESLYYPNEHTQ